MLFGVGVGWSPNLQWIHNKVFRLKFFSLCDDKQTLLEWYIFSSSADEWLEPIEISVGEKLFKVVFMPNVSVAVLEMGLERIEFFLIKFLKNL